METGLLGGFLGGFQGGFRGFRVVQRLGAATKPSHISSAANVARRVNNSLCYECTPESYLLVLSFRI